MSSYFDYCDIDNDGVKSLAIAVLYQAVYDYRELSKQKVLSKKDRSGKYSRKEIARFFKGEWCDCVLALSGINIKGEKIIEYLKSQDTGDRVIAAYTKGGEFVKTFDTLTESARFSNQEPCNISHCLSGRRKTAGGYIWKYIDGNSV